MSRRPMNRSRTMLPAAAIAITLAFGLAACSPSAESVSSELHSSVVQVAERAAAGDYIGALAELALLDRDVAEAVDAGTIGAEQAQEIDDAIALVRADLEAAEVATTPTPTDDDDDDDGPGNSDNKGNDDKGKDDKGNGNKGNDD